MELLVITVTVTIKDEKFPEIHPIHRHDVYGITDSDEIAGDMLRAAIANAGFRTSQFDTRIRMKHPTCIYTTKKHIRDIVEEYEWLVERITVNQYEKI